MVGAERSTKTLTLSQLCSRLPVSARQVQYLRESGIVVPSVVRKGRGRACLYSVDDAILVYVALVDLAFMDGDTKRSVITSISLSDSIAKIEIGTATQLLINIEELRKVIHTALLT